MSQEFQHLDPSVVRGLLSPRLTRRQALQAAGAAGIASLLIPGVASAATGDANWWKSQSKKGTLNFANWPYYIDTYNGAHPTLDNLQSTKGISVNYSEVIEDNPSFYQRIRPSLQAGSSTGYDLIVMTDNSVELRYLLNGNYLIPLDTTAMTNFNKYASAAAKAAFTKSGKRLMPWQSGWTSLAYDDRYVNTSNKNSLKLAFDTSSANVSKYRNRVGMMSDPIELGNMGLLAIGVDPTKSKPSDWTKAATKLRAQRDSGLVRAYYDNSYIDDLKNGNIWIAQCYSGDIFQATVGGNKHLHLVVPTEGMLLWTDNMAIPAKADHPRDAMIAMDYFYDPSVQAVLEYYINYICPVPTAAAKMKAPTAGWETTTMNNLKKDIGTAPATIAAAPTIFPTSAYTKASKGYYAFKSQGEIDTWHATFSGIPTGS